MTSSCALERRSAEMVNALFEAVPQEIAVIDHDDEVVGWNKHATRLFPRPWSRWASTSATATPRKARTRCSR
ncbi:MAG: hypothetical protein QME74_02530 [Candidatus Edwardsbacteria bacterium]|nr:hypothetical protein [Candidatus Edwardsbacteria bacterium]